MAIVTEDTSIRSVIETTILEYCKFVGIVLIGTVMPKAAFPGFCTEWEQTSPQVSELAKGRRNPLKEE